MQLKKLTLATLLALSLAACGGGDDDGSNQPVDPQDPTVNPDDQGQGDNGNASNDGFVQPENEDVGYGVQFDIETQSSILSGVKVRGATSEFDINPAKGESQGTRQYSNRMGSLNIGESAQGDKYLTNIQLAHLKGPASDEAVADSKSGLTEGQTVQVNQLVGMDPSAPEAGKLYSVAKESGITATGGAQPTYYNGYTKVDDNTSLQLLNEPNVVVAGATLLGTGASTAQAVADPSGVVAVTPTTAAQGTADTDYDYYADAAKAQAAYDEVVAQRTNLQNATSAADVTAAKTDLAKAEKAWETARNAMNTKLATQLKKVAKETPNGVESGIGGILLPSTGTNLLFAQTAVDAPISTVGTAGPIDHGLVGIDIDNTHAGIWGNDDDYVTTTRVFGHYYLDPGAKKIDGNAVAMPEDYNSYLRGDVITVGTHKGELVVFPTILNEVQYGRVTADLDYSSSAYLVTDAGKFEYRISPLAAHNPAHDGSEVDTYFARGVNPTKVDTMNNLFASDQVLNYQGHAIMFGLDNKFHGGKTAGDSPNAVVIKNSEGRGLGNFVQARFDTGAKTLTGDVYNVWAFKADDGSVKRVMDSLVEFNADVRGNTVAGKANLTYDKASEGEIRGSFFGANADELGGTFSAVTYDQNKSSEISWGGAFGAKKVTKATGYSNLDFYEAK
ncbi:MAG: transferrin-binding protein-like solute binding protein [Neisseriaceae bacterium]|nr:transferrin-binding protein-like solute binding protein [Neisseriaceae bacterium]